MSSTNEAILQSFTAPATGRLYAITMWLGGTANNGNAASFTLYRAGANGLPNGTGQAYGGDFLSGSSNTQQVVAYPSGGMQVTAGEKLAIEVYAYGGTKYFEVTSGAYAGGSMFQQDLGEVSGTYEPFPVAGVDLRMRMHIEVEGNVAASISGTPTTPVTIGSSYSYAYTVGGTPAPFRVYLASGTLPPGLSISNAGVLSGAPTAAGSYTFTLRADNGTETPITSTVVVQSATPGAPTAVVATAGNTSASVSFAAPAYTGTSGISGYLVTASPGNLTCSTTAATVCAVTGLTANTPYTFTVTASNASGAGPASVASSAVTVYTTPAAPGNLAAVRGNGSVALSWDAAAANSSPITSYEVAYKLSADSAWTAATPTASLGTTVTGLANGSQYDFRVRALNAAGYGDWSAPPATVTPATVPAQMAPPVTLPLDRGALLLWSAPASGGSALGDYQLRVRAIGSPAWSATSAVGVAGAGVPDLINGTEYEFQVRATNAVGEGDWSASSTATPLGQPVAPVNLTATRGDSIVALSWDAADGNGRAVLGYRIYQRIGAGPWSLAANSAALSSNITMLTNGTAYEFAVAAVTVWGEGERSTASATPGALPGVPLSLTATPGDTSSALTWIAPADLGGFPLDSYDVQYRLVGDPIWIDAGAVVPTAFDILALVNGAAYEFRVRAGTAVGDGTWTAPVIATPFTVPDAPDNLAMTVGLEELLVSWDAPVDNGAAIIDYTVEFRAASALIWSSVASTGTSVTIGPFTTSEVVSVRVKARSAAGDSGWSGTVTETPEIFEPRFETPGGAALSGTALSAGDEVVIRGEGAPAGATGDVWMHSAPVLLGTFTVGSDGSYELRARVPASVGAGSHRIIATLGAALDTAEISVIVLPTKLAASGVDPALLTVIAIVLVLFGVRVTSRRRWKAAR